MPAVLEAVTKVDVHWFGDYHAAVDDKGLYSLFFSTNPSYVLSFGPFTTICR
jgi:hypothetical protein